MSRTTTKYLVPAVAALVALLLIVWLVVGATSAAFTATTTNAANSWDAGTLSLSDDDAAVAMFSATGMAPGDSFEHCILVTRAGSVEDADVELYAAMTAPGGAPLDSYLDITIEEGAADADGDGDLTPGEVGFAECTDFVADGAPIFDDTLDQLSTVTDSSTGVGTWLDAQTGDERVYKFTVSMDAGVGNAAQGLESSTVDFIWEAVSNASEG
jgi:hypothetical protein